MRSQHVPLAESSRFRAFYKEHRSAVLRYFARKVLDPEVALDLCADTFAQAFIGRHRFRGNEEQAIAWLFTIARSRLSDYFRRGTAERKALRRLGIELPKPHSDELVRVEQLIDLEPVRNLVREAIAALNEEQRVALQLRIVDELPYSDVALGLGVSEQTARARVSRALKALSGALPGDFLAEEMP